MFDLSSAEGIHNLNSYLSDKSYIEGYAKMLGAYALPPPLDKQLKPYLYGGNTSVYIGFQT